MKTAQPLPEFSVVFQNMGAENFYRKMKNQTHPLSLIFGKANHLVCGSMNFFFLEEIWFNHYASKFLD